MDNPSVTIIILNWNGWRDTIECIESVFQINYTNFKVLVIDNNSSDNSIRKIEEYAAGKEKVSSNFFKYNFENKPIEISTISKEESKRNLLNNKQLILIKNEINYGYAEGNNIGIKFALKNLNSDYILLLNNDMVVDKDFLNFLLLEGEKEENVGLLGPKIYYYDNPNTIWCIGGKIDWKLARGIHIGINSLDNGQYDEKKNFDYISGSSLLIKKELIENIGLLDKKFFLYFEETDLALRASENGYKNLYVPNAKVWHKISKSGGGISKPIGLYYITRNRWIFMKKWAKKNDYAFFIVYQLIGAIFFPLVLSIYYRNWKLFKAYYYGFLNGIIKA